MAYVAPPNFVSGAVLTEANLDILSDDIAYLYGIANAQAFSGCQVTRAASTNIADATTTPITWTAETFDLGSWWASGTNIVVPAAAIPAGYTTVMVMVSARDRWAASGTGARTLSVAKNGSAFGAVTTSGIAGETLDQSVIEFTSAVVGDIFTVTVAQSSGGVLAVSNTVATVCRFAPLS